MNLLSNQENDITFIRKLQNTQRLYLVENQYSRNNFLTKSVEELEELLKVHRIAESKEMYLRMEDQLEKQVLQLDSERQNRYSTFINIVLGLIAIIGIIGILSDLTSVVTNIGTLNKDINLTNLGQSDVSILRQVLVSNPILIILGAIISGVILIFSITYTKLLK